MDEKVCQIVRMLQLLEVLRGQKAGLIRAQRLYDYGTTAQSFILQPGVDSPIQRNARVFLGIPGSGHYTVLHDAGCYDYIDLVQDEREKWLNVCERYADKLVTAQTVLISQNAMKDVLKGFMAFKRQSNMLTVDINDETKACNKNPQTGQPGIPLIYGLDGLPPPRKKRRKHRRREK